MIRYIYKSVAAGIAILIGATVYLSCDNKVVGAILFSVGLLIVCHLNLNLYTGKVGYLYDNSKDKTTPKQVFICWVGNLIGVAMTAQYVRYAIPSIVNKADAVLQNKLSFVNNGLWLEFFLLSVMCGILIFAAVEAFKHRTIGDLIIIFCVTAFIVCGFEHSIADMSYAFLGCTSYKEIPSIIIMILIATFGNAFGSIVFRMLSYSKNEGR